MAAYRRTWPRSGFDWRLAFETAWYVALVAFVVAILIWPALARDDGRYANSDLKPWFDGLKSQNGLCCSVADGVSVKDVDWEARDGRYRVRLNGEWLDVPDDAVVTEPNRYGPAIVWPIVDATGKTVVRCFIAGAGA